MYRVYDTRMTVNVGCPPIAEVETLSEAIDFMWNYVTQENGNTDETRDQIVEHILIKEEGD